MIYPTHDNVLHCITSVTAALEWSTESSLTDKACPSTMYDFTECPTVINDYRCLQRLSRITTSQESVLKRQMLYSCAQGWTTHSAVPTYNSRRISVAIALEETSYSFGILQCHRETRRSGAYGSFRGGSKWLRRTITLLRRANIRIIRHF